MGTGGGEERAGGRDAGRQRERRARVIGVAVALATAVAASLTLHWPALVVAAMAGYGAYRLAGGGRSGSPPGEPRASRGPR